jgi:hypothetical protein
MPGLLRGVARTAVVAGTATAVSNRVSRRQSERWSRQYEADAAAPVPAEPPEAAPAPPTETDRFEALKQLGELKAQGILTDEEFQAEKARILSS